MFFWFNLDAILAIAASNMAWDVLGGHWIVLALAWTVHIFWTIGRGTYSPGLVSSLLYLIVL